MRCTVTMATYKNFFCKSCQILIIGLLSGAARGVSKRGKLPPHFCFGLFSSLCNLIEKIFLRVYPWIPQNFCRFVVSLMKQAVKKHCLTCKFFFVSNIN